MKSCTKCREMKPLTDFYTNKNTKDGRQSCCKKCSCIATQDSRKRWYEENKTKHRECVKKRKHALFRWMWELKSKLKCEVCGENHPATLDFHHTDPSKKDLSISLMCKWGYTKEKILAEIEKCQVWCSNCHRKFHWSHHDYLQ